MRTSLGLIATGALGAVATVTIVANAQSPAIRPCKPAESAWAILVRVTDAATQLPIRDAVIGAELFVRANTDSVGTVCLRTLTGDSATLDLDRPGYQRRTLVARGKPGQVVAQDVQLARVTNPCCQLLGSWTIRLVLEKPAGTLPRRKNRRAFTPIETGGGLEFGPQYANDARFTDVDSLVKTVYGRHQVDLAPFFGGPYARDVSTTIFGGGGDLLREISGTIPDGDAVWITFIPRMSHGGLSLEGRIVNDTIRGVWQQNAYCCGATGFGDILKGGFHFGMGFYW